MGELDFISMKSQSGKTFDFSVAGITQYGIAAVGKMNSYLMGSTGLGEKFDKAKIIKRINY